MMMVFAFGISRPLSMMVVESSTSASPLTNLVITSSRSSLSIWPWPTTMRALRQQRRASFCAIVSMVMHAVVQEENLAAAIQFALDGVADDALVVLRDDGLDRQPVVRRRLDGAHVARAGEREVKRARNRRGAQREHVHQRAQQLELLLVHHAEALLLVNDHQPEVLERDVVLQQPMRADDDVHRARRQILDDALAARAGVRKRESSSMRTG